MDGAVRLRLVAGQIARRGEVEPRVGHPRLVADLLRHFELGPIHLVGAGLIAIPVGQPTSGRERIHPGLSRGIRTGHRQGGLGPNPTLREMALELPEPPQGACEPQRRLFLAGVDRPAHRRPDVRVVESQPVEPHWLPGREQLRRCDLREIQERHRVASTCVAFRALVGEPTERDVLDRLDHGEPDAARLGLIGGSRIARDQAVLRQREHALEAVVDRMGRADDRRSLLDVEATLEDGKCQEGCLLVGRQQIDAPADRSVERSLASGRVARPRAGSGSRAARRSRIAGTRARTRARPPARSRAAGRQVARRSRR